MRELTIGDHIINDDSDAFICAEIGSNHQGSVEICKRMIHAAQLAGADAVKLQKRDLATWERDNPELWHSAYHSEHSFGATYGEHRRALEFADDAYREVRDYARGLGLVFFATAFDVASVQFLEGIGVPAIKIASGSIVNRPLLSRAAATEKPLVVSTGGATPGEIVAAAQTICEMGRTLETSEARPFREETDYPYALLACTSLYPCPPSQLHLRVIEEMRKNFPGVVIGLSDHQDGIDMAPVAYALGARIFEKHFCLDHTAKGSDQAMSLEPRGLEMYVRSLRRTRVALGDGIKRRLDGEAAALVKQGRKDLAV
jgi:sialic acid synthase